MSKHSTTVVKMSGKEKVSMEKAIKLAMHEVVPVGTTGFKTHNMRVEARRAAEARALEVWVEQHPEAGVKLLINRSITLKVVELVTTLTETELGQIVTYTEALPGTVAHAINDRNRVHLDTEIRYCSGQYIEGFEENCVLVRLPSVGLDGKTIAQEDIEAVLRRWIRKTGRGIFWTQSGVKKNGVDKAVTFGSLPMPLFKVVFGAMDWDMDAFRLGAYGGLILSNTGSQKYNVQVTMEIVNPIDGQDGNRPVNPIFVGGRNQQFRAIELNEAHTQILALGKGTLYPVASAGAPTFDWNQVKFASNKTGLHTFIILNNENVKAAETASLGWASAELPLMLEDTPLVRRYLAALTKKEVTKLLSMMTQDKLGELWAYLGGMSFTDFELDKSLRGILDMLASNYPWSAEMFGELGKFLMKIITQAVIPSCGIKVRQSLLCQSEKYGKYGCSAEAAGVIGYGMPVQDPGDVETYAKSAFKENQGMVLSYELIDGNGRDSDGDYWRETVKREIVRLVARFKISTTVFATAIKPTKEKANMAISGRAMYEIGMEIVGQGHIVGTATDASWRCLQAAFVCLRANDQAGYSAWMKLASDYAWYAKTAPMTAKHNIRINGVTFADAFRAFHSANSKALYGEKDEDGVHVGGIVLNWREAQKAAKQWTSPYQLADATIENPQSVIDVCWNAAVEAAQEWKHGNQRDSASVASLTTFVIDRRGGEIPAWAFFQAREFAGKWNEYWHIPQANRSKTADSHMRDEAARFYSTCSEEVIDATLAMRKQDGTAQFGLHKCIAKVGRVTKALGLRPQVVKYVEAKHPEIAEDARFARLIVKNLN